MPDGNRIAATTRVTYLIKRLELAVRAHLDTVTATLGLTTPQYAALSVLRRKPGISSAELARLSFVSAQAMHEMVMGLERKDLIRRENGQRNRKVLRIYLTAEGSRVLDACEREADALEDKMFANLGPRAAIALVDGLRSCAEALSEAPD